MKDGLLTQNGMVGFAEVMDDDAIEAVRAYVIDLAHKEKARKEKSSEPDPEAGPSHGE